MKANWLSIVMIIVLAAPVVAQTDRQESRPAAVETDRPSTPYNPQPTPPPLPSGPRWRPAESEEFRAALEQFRLDVEARRAAKPDESLTEYREGIAEYRALVRKYKDMKQAERSDVE